MIEDSSTFFFVTLHHDKSPAYTVYDIVDKKELVSVFKN